MGDHGGGRSSSPNLLANARLADGPPITTANIKTANHAGPKIATATMAMIQQIVMRSMAGDPSGLGCGDSMERSVPGDQTKGINTWLTALRDARARVT